MKKTITFFIVSFIAVAGYSQKGTYCNPVSDTLFAADPYVLFHDGLYYLYATSAGDGFKYWISGNLSDWEEKGYAFRKTGNSWGKGSFWAPEVIHYNNKFYMVYSASGETMYGRGMRICLAVSDNPGGPFTDIHAPLFDPGFSCIDGHIFVDTGDKPYLYYEMVGAVGEHWKNQGYLWGMVMGVALSPDLSKILHEPKLCLYTSQDWEHPESMKARSNEGMTVFKKDGIYYMTYSANHYADPDYGVGYAVSDRPLGMWVKYIRNPILKQDPSIGVSGPGHNCIVKSPDQKEWFIVYHSHANPDKPGGGRILNIDRLIFHSDSTLSVKGPTRTPQPLPSGCAGKAGPVTGTCQESEFKKWALTPPMGWNSWDCYGPTVREHEVKANADYMAANLKEFGWEYIVVDIRWFVENTTAGGYNQKDPRYVLDEYGRYLPAVNRFPSANHGKGFKELADYIHRKGLKFGIHIMRGIPKVVVEKKLPVKGTGGITADQIYTTDDRCKWLRDNYTILADKVGAQEYYNSIFELYARWGVDFIKVDDLSAPIYHKDEIELIRQAIDHCGRPIVLSTSPGPTPPEEADHVSKHANMWRMVNDVWDSWWHIRHLFDVCEDWYDYIKPGTWPDCDMIPLGRLSIRGERGEDRMTRLTKDEQYALMTLFTIFKSPLFFGGDLPGNDDFTLSLLTNREVLQMHAESTGVRQLYRKEDKVAITSINEKSGWTYLALFNIADTISQDVEVKLADLGLAGNARITNMWTGEEAGVFNDVFVRNLSAHASGLYKIERAE